VPLGISSGIYFEGFEFLTGIRNKWSDFFSNLMSGKLCFKFMYNSLLLNSRNKINGGDLYD